MTVEFKTPCKMYGHTDVVVTPECVERGYAPCGNGDDYKLSKREKEQLRDIFAGKKDAITFEQDRPKLIRMTEAQAINAMRNGRSVYLSPECRKEWRAIYNVKIRRDEVWNVVEQANDAKYDDYGERSPFTIRYMQADGRVRIQSDIELTREEIIPITHLRFKL